MDKPEWKTIRKDKSNIIEQLIDNGFDVRAFNEPHRTTFGYTVSNRNAQKIDFDNSNSYRAASGYADMKAAKNRSAARIRTDGQSPQRRARQDWLNHRRICSFVKFCLSEVLRCSLCFGACKSSAKPHHAPP